MAPQEPRSVGVDVVYEGHKVRLEVHRIEEPGGRRAVREVVRHNGSVAVLALRPGPDGGREVLLERNFRYAIGRYVVEIPAGTLDRADEPPAECARRELVEETGWRAERMRELLTILPSPGVLTERLTVFVAEGLAAGEADLEPGELIQVEWTPWPQALAMVRSGAIQDAKTVAALLYYDAFGAAAASR